MGGAAAGCGTTMPSLLKMVGNPHFAQKAASGGFTKEQPLCMRPGSSAHLFNSGAPHFMQ
jgi:hypothetical protein